MKRSAGRLKSYRGRGVLLTGASSGIGRALSLRLASEGARLVLVARRRNALEELAEEVVGAGGEALPLVCDVSDRLAVERCVEQAVEHFGAIDVLINNAGYGHHRTFLEWDVSDMERMMRVNYLGAVYFTKALLPWMVDRERGWVVFVASVAGKIASPEESAYVASKFALVGLAESLSMEVEDAGVAVLTVCPGVIRTPFFDAEALERMPPFSRRAMVEVDGLVKAILAALARGKREMTYPRGIALGYIVRAVAPRFFRRQVRRTTLDAVSRERARSRVR